VIELEVVGVRARPISDEEGQRWREQAEEALAQHPPPRQGAVVVDVPSRMIAVRLKERAGDRVLDISIGDPEAAAISFGLHGVLQPRPMTHDFIGNLLQALDDVSVRRVVITKRERATFHARLELQHRDQVVHVDCRPSDGIALAIRLSVPIIAADDLEPLLAAA
jgi:bifunctional DNase/RNase